VYELIITERMDGKENTSSFSLILAQTITVQSPSFWIIQITRICHANDLNLDTDEK